MKHEGYLIIDHRASPGMPGIPELGEGTVYEAATQFCNHCAVNVRMNRYRIRARFSCPKCEVYLCDVCAAAYHRNKVCRPWSQVVEDIKTGKTLVPVLAKNVNPLD